MENNRYYEKEIDLTDTLGHIIAKWRFICFITFLGFLAGIAIACVSGLVDMKKNDIETQKVAISESKSKALGNLQKDKDYENLKDIADKNLIKYINIQSLYNMQEKYNNESIYANLNATHIATAQLNYYIDNHYINEYPVVNSYNNISDIMVAYQTMLITDEVCNDIITSLNINTEPKYIKELITVQFTSSSSLTIIIKTDNEALTNEIAEYYKNLMPEITKELNTSYGNITSTLQEEQLYIDSDINIMASQNQANNNLIDYYDQLQSFESSMKGDQLEYFKAILAESKLESVKAKSSQNFYDYVSKKTIITITIAVLFIISFIYILQYIFSGTIKTASDLTMISRSTLLGTVLINKKTPKTIFDKIAVSLTDKKTMCKDSDQMIRVIATSVSHYMNSNNLKNILFVGSEIAHLDVLNTIRSHVCASGYNADIATDVFDSPEKIDLLAKADIIVFTGEICKSKYDNLERIMSMCELYKKPVMGTVAIQESILK